MMEPASLDFRVIQSLAPFQSKPLLVDAVDKLSQNALVNGFVFIIPLFLIWHSAEPGRRWLAQRLLVAIVLATFIGILVSLVLQQFFRWPPPSSHPALIGIYNPIFQGNPNPNSFPSDSAILFSIVALGASAWNRNLGAGLLIWLLIFVAPVKIFVGGHYPSDIAAGLVIGFLSLRLSNYLVKRFQTIENLASNQAWPFRVGMFLWLFEIGNEFRDLTEILSSLHHIRRHF